MNLKSIELSGFKSFAQKVKLEFKTPISAIVGPNGSGKSNVAEAFRFVLGEQSIKSMRGKRGEDLIFNGSINTPKANRASVKIVFDNKSKLFDVNYDEIILERTVHRDGTNSYFINQSSVRLKDIIELLSNANMGPTGHHIISQGESDRILNVNSKERKSMIEDALGLKIYFYKKKESLKKLDKTEQNIKEIQSIRREIKPHLRFLKKQVDKIKDTEVLRDKLRLLYKEYLKRERIYIDSETSKIEQEKIQPENELKQLENKLKNSEEVLNNIKLKSSNESFGEPGLLRVENSIKDLKNQENEIIRDIAKLEGEVLFLEKIENSNRQKFKEKSISISLIEDLKIKIEDISKETEFSNDLKYLKETIFKIIKLFSDFISRNKSNNETENISQEGNLKKIKNLNLRKDELNEKLNLIKDRVINLEEKRSNLKKEFENKHIEEIETEKTVLEIKAKISDLKSVLNSIYSREKIIHSDKTRFEEEMREALVLIGKEVSDYMHSELSEENNIREKQETRRKEVERIKIKLEDSGTGLGSEVINEYEETFNRDQFLEKEIQDLENSKESLNKLIKDLEEKLNIEFKEGIEKINSEFNKFFSLMFGGGSASIEVVKIFSKKISDNMKDQENLTEEFNEEEETENEGVEINVSLPHKKIKGLNMLSGGERALTSIALTFAISQINPPPFIILDETDAALDESNSKKYGDIIEKLAEFSQLVLITHNRETMSRGGILYGITMGSNGVSKTLSIELEDAVKIAK